MSEKPLVVAAAVIQKKDLILIAQRKKNSFLEPNKWEFPGGKVEPGERLEDCLIREVKEELGIEIVVNGLFMVHTHVYHKKGRAYPIQLHVYLAEWKCGQVRTIDCQDFRWVFPHELERFDFVEGDKSILQKVVMRLQT